MNSNKSITAHFTLTPTPTPTPMPTPTQTATPTITPVNIRIDYIGVENAYGGNVQLSVVASDGDTNIAHSIPQDDGYYQMQHFEVQQINRRVFHAEDRKGDLKLNILAYHRDQSIKTNLDMLNMMEWYYGDSINMLKQLVLNMPANDRLIGEYAYTWYKDEPFTSGQYYKTSGDLHVWFSVWSDTEPVPVLTPAIEPDVYIQNVSLPTNAQKRPDYEYWLVTTYYTSVQLVNNESVDITIRWEGHDSVTGNFDSGSITVPKEGFAVIKKDYYYSASGEHQITYKIYYRDTLIDSWTGTMIVTP